MTDDEIKGSDNGEPIITAEIVSTVQVKITAILGSAKMPISSILKFRRGSVVELNRKIAEPIDLYINDKLIARGEVVVVNQSVGISLTEIVNKN